MRGMPHGALQPRHCRPDVPVLFDCIAELCADARRERAQVNTLPSRFTKGPEMNASSSVLAFG